MTKQGTSKAATGMAQTPGNDNDWDEVRLSVITQDSIPSSDSDSEVGEAERDEARPVAVIVICVCLVFMLLYIIGFAVAVPIMRSVFGRPYNGTGPHNDTAGTGP